MSAPDPAAIVPRFRFGGEVETVTPYAGGHINDSFLVTVGGAPARRFLLQRINARVFPHPARVMENVANVTHHLRRRLTTAGVPDLGRRVLTLVPALDDAPWVVDADGGVWRAFAFIEGTRSGQRAGSPAEAEGAARAFGAFVALLADYDGPPIHETIPGFHDTARRFAALEAAVAADRVGRLAGVRHDVERVTAHRHLADLLPPLIADGALPVRIVHNDAKIANVLFDAATGEAICVVDLDTVMPGCALHDFGDLVRSAASDAAEDEGDPAKVRADPERVAALTRGWLAGAGEALTPGERELMPIAGRLITLEQAVRFLTDHLDGDRYYRVAYPDQNLVRARAQMALFGTL